MKLWICSAAAKKYLCQIQCLEPICLNRLFKSMPLRNLK
jgi:hypothetical protein